MKEGKYSLTLKGRVHSKIRSNSEKTDWILAIDVKE